MPSRIASLLHDLNARSPDRFVRLETLQTLRWLAIGGQTAAVIAAREVFGAELPLFACAAAILASVALNVALIAVYPRTKRLSDTAAMFSMLFDLAQVSVLIFLTGGLANPFAALLLAPVTISASALQLRSVVIVASTALAFIAIMAIWGVPLRFASGEVLQPPPIYIFGVWAALTITVIFMSVYARRIAVETDRMRRALRAAESALGREQRLTAIGGLAAAAAHELGTPLATIKLVSNEMIGELTDPHMREDAELIRDQADRCRDILADMSEGARSDSHVARIPIHTLIDEAAAPHAERGRRIITRLNGAPADAFADAPIVRRTPEAVHGLRNLIQNAVDFASACVWIDVSHDDQTLTLTVGDDGPGFPPDKLERLGEPYVTSRRRRMGEGDEGYVGMGLGLFIAKTLLERTGARVRFTNADRAIRRANRGEPLEERRPSGAVASVRWRIEDVAPTGADRAPLGENPRFTHANI